MNSIPIPPDDFLKEGFYVGDPHDLMDKDESIYFDSKTTELKTEIDKNRESILQCRYDYSDPNNPTVNYKSPILYNEIEERDSYIKENNLLVVQQWYEIPPDGGLFNYHSEYMQDLCIKIINTFYPKIQINPIWGSFTLYEDGHFIEPHRDQANEGRICAIIIYFSKESEWNDGSGELVLTSTSGKTYEIKPFIGTYCLLDFTKNNIMHEVKKVRNGFKRYAYISFVTIKKDSI